MMYDYDELWLTPDGRKLCVILVDVSASMNGERMMKVNSFLKKYVMDVTEDDLMRGSIETVMFTFGESISEVVSFKPIDAMADLPLLEADDDSTDRTRMNEAILHALRRIEERKMYFRENAISYYRPEIFLLTDGYATDVEWEGEARQAMREAIKSRRAAFFPIVAGECEDTGLLLQTYGLGGQRVFSVEEYSPIEMITILTDDTVFFELDTPLPDHSDEEASVSLPSPVVFYNSETGKFQPLPPCNDESTDTGDTVSERMDDIPESWLPRSEANKAENVPVQVENIQPILTDDFPVVIYINDKGELQPLPPCNDEPTDSGDTAFERMDDIPEPWLPHSDKADKVPNQDEGIPPILMDDSPVVFFNPETGKIQPLSPCSDESTDTEDTAFERMDDILEPRLPRSKADNVENDPDWVKNTPIPPMILVDDFERMAIRKIDATEIEPKEEPADSTHETEDPPSRFPCMDKTTSTIDYFKEVTTMEDRTFDFNPAVLNVPTNAGVERVVCVILADVSGSMTERNKIKEVNEGIQNYMKAIEADDRASQSVETTLITFGSQVDEVITCAEIDTLKSDFKPLVASGLTRMNEAILLALTRIEERKKFYKDNAINYKRPWIFLLTDGLSTDDELETEASQRMRDAILGKHVVLFPLAVGSGRDGEVAAENLLKYVPNGAVAFRASESNFGEMFQWLSTSMISTSHTDPSSNDAGVASALPLNVKPVRWNPDTGMMENL